MRLHFFLLFAALCGLVVSAPLSQAVEKAFTEKDGFTVTLDDRWNSVPRAVLDQFGQDVAAATGLPPQLWNYAYQISSAQDRLEYPYILVQVKLDGPVPESELRNAAKFQPLLKQGIDGVEEATQGAIKSASGETIRYDEPSQTLVATATTEILNVGQVEIITAVKLVKNGTLQFHGYVPKTDAPNFLPLLERVFTTVKLSPELQYQSTSSWKSMVRNGAIGALAGLVIVLIWKRAKRPTEEKV